MEKTMVLENDFPMNPPNAKHHAGYYRPTVSIRLIRHSGGCCSAATHYVLKLYGLIGKREAGHEWPGGLFQWA
ncbi:unnamed protein product [Rhizopus microsporus]